MHDFAAHFAPNSRIVSKIAETAAPSVVSVASLAGVSELVRTAFGDKVLRQANQVVMLDVERIENQNCFITHAMMTKFLIEVERQTGEPNLDYTLLRTFLSKDMDSGARMSFRPRPCVALSSVRFPP